MTEPKDQNQPDLDVEEAPEAVIQKKNRISIVWLVPLVAAFIGGWLAYKAITEKGPSITISFQSAEGLEAGKTKLKYKDVEIGKVEDIRLSEDLSKVLVTAQLVKEADRYLLEDTQFWVVRARVAAGEVSGISTLFSGAYIGVAPGKKGASTRWFDGLEVPPVVTTDLPGRHFRLHAESLGSIEVGSPVYFRQLKVGQVVSYQLAEDGPGIAVEVFIEAPHHQRVRTNTRFWNASGIDVTLGASGVKIDTESLVTILAGGVAFDTPASLAPGEPVKENAIFTLYESRQSSYERTYAKKVPYLLHFNQSVKGLLPGSPVEFHGIKIGHVVEVNLAFDMADLSFKIPVLIEIEPERFMGSESHEEDREEILKILVEQGLRAQLKKGNLLTGVCIVDLDFHPKAPPAQISFAGPYPELPTIAAPLEEITASAANLLKKLEMFPLDQLGKDLHKTIIALDQTLAETRQLLGNMDNQLTPGLGETLSEVQKTLEEVQGALGADSPVRHEAREAMTELGKASRSMRVLTDYLQRHPESLLYGKGPKE